MDPRDGLLAAIAALVQVHGARAGPRSSRPRGDGPLIGVHAQPRAPGRDPVRLVGPRPARRTPAAVSRASSRRVGAGTTMSKLGPSAPEGTGARSRRRQGDRRRVRQEARSRATQHRRFGQAGAQQDSTARSAGSTLTSPRTPSCAGRPAAVLPPGFGVQVVTPNSVWIQWSSIRPLTVEAQVLGAGAVRVRRRAGWRWLCSQLSGGRSGEREHARCGRSTTTAPVAAERCSPNGSPWCQIGAGVGAGIGRAGRTDTVQLYGRPPAAGTRCLMSMTVVVTLDGRRARSGCTVVVRRRPGGGSR